MKFIETINDFIGLFIIGVVIVCIAMFIQNGYNNLTYVTSKIDNRKYLVRNIEDKQEAADMLAIINQKLEKLKIHLETKYPNDERIKRLQINYIPENVCESASHDKNTSYSVNKGEKVVFCIRSKETDKLEDINTLMFVAIHEMGHLASGTVGHNKEFWDNFEFLLREAIDIGLYNKVEYSKNPKSYCGIQITDSPVE
jgi:hypothetical protein